MSLAKPGGYAAEYANWKASSINRGVLRVLAKMLIRPVTYCIWVLFGVAACLSGLRCILGLQKGMMNYPIKS